MSSKKVKDKTAEISVADKVGAPPEPKVKTKAKNEPQEGVTRHKVGKFEVVTY